VIDGIARIDLFIQDKVRHGDGSDGTAHLGHRDTLNLISENGVMSGVNFISLPVLYLKESMRLSVTVSMPQHISIRWFSIRMVRMQSHF
jgi:hypothetical protein